MMYRISEVRKNVLFVESDTQYALTSMFMRVQEFYESPLGVKGRYFSTEEYMDLYAASRPDGHFSYYSDWCGFNIPSHILLRFFEIFKYDFTAKESMLMSLVRSRSPEDIFYLVGVCKEKKTKIATKHELAHAYWYLDTKYKEKMLDKINDLPDHLYIKAEDHLVSIGYDVAVLTDEMQAYLATGPKDEVLTNLGWEEDNPRVPRCFKAFFDDYDSKAK